MPNAIRANVIIELLMSVVPLGLLFDGLWERSG
jgi:hypothetical protein